ncbi:MAG: hypothetical protein K0R99_2052 [Microbacterium sp.]|uniref:hypothetical protein n=1 Tax=Microbacterium sp. TaxID=51671 RepID=UPI00260F0A61|nr:hypothetical protein [Microbacterium sp.]MDF2560606.1 hypothetical protein [Microbacterium sp.]
MVEERAPVDDASAMEEAAHAERSVATGPDADSPTWMQRRGRLVDWIVAIVLVIASVVLVVWQVPQHKMVSPIDEYVYIDYLAKVPTQFVVHRGEETGEYARLYLSCNGVRTLGYYPADFCTDWQEADEETMPNGGKTTADIYTPVYFGATWLLAQPLVLLGISDITEAGRYTGVVWLAAAAVLLYLTLRRLRVDPVTAGSLGLLLVGSLSAYWSNTYISTDAMSLLAGSLMAFCLTMFLRGSRWVPWLFVGSAVLLTLAKMQNLMGVAAAAVTLIFWALADAFRRGRGAEGRWRSLVRDRRVISAFAAVIVSVIAQGAWAVIRNMIVYDTRADQGVEAPLSKRALVEEVLRFFPGVSKGAIDPGLVGIAAQIASAVMAWVIVAGVIGLIAASRRGSRSESLALATFFVALVSGPLLAIATVVMAGYYFYLPARYGMSLLAFFLVCAGLLFTRSVWTRWFSVAVAVVSYVAVMTLTG